MMCSDFITCPLPRNGGKISHSLSLQTPEGFGFNVMGGKEQKCPIYISRIIPGGYADKQGTIRRGDQLLSVNGEVSREEGGEVGL